MKFIDSAKINLASGAGGKGCVSWNREKYREFGGPNGGSGGRGGHVIIQGNSGLYSLYDLKMNPHQKAKNGQPGSSRNKTGKKGQDLIISVPLGTIIYDNQNDQELCEIVSTTPKILLRGGRGGKGNAFFKSNVNKAPDYAQPGEASKKIIVRLELKVLADAGLVGFPNVGKSSFLAAVSRAQPKVADYPFTTLTPQLGVVKLDDYSSFTIADIPGLISGASQGSGLGFEFLKHIQRTKVLVFLLDASNLSDTTPIMAYQKLTQELADFSKDLLSKKIVVLLTKIDLLTAKTSLTKTNNYFKNINQPVIEISSLTGSGLKAAIKAIQNCLLVH